MVEYNKTSDLLKALSDDTRRSILTVLCQQGPSRVTDIAKHYDMSLNAVSKHIKNLESAGLVKRVTLGRVHVIQAQLDELHLIQEWLDQMQSIWSLRLDAMNALLNTGDTENDER